MKALLRSLQSATGATTSETIVVLSLCGLLIAGHAVDALSDLLRPPTAETATTARIHRLIDSMLTAGGPPPPAARVAGTETPSPGPERPPALRRPAATPAPPLRRPINLNTASLTRLQDIPGVGEATARRIVEERRLRPFERPEDIMRIRGIGEKKYARMQPYIIAP